jgi:hypothetical protein
MTYFLCTFKTEIAGNGRSNVQVDNAEGKSSAGMRDEKFIQMEAMKIE